MALTVSRCTPGWCRRYDREVRIDTTSLLHRVELLARRHPRLALASWILTAEYFLAQVIVALMTQSTYGWRTDSISYLGVTQCGIYGGEYICSPLHAVFNISLMVLAVAMAVGTFFIYHQFNKNRGTLAGCSALAVAAFGALLVGIFPENTVNVAHDVGSGLSFIGGLVGVFTLSFALRGLPTALRGVMVCSGIISAIGVLLLALVFFADFRFTGIAERMTSYPQILWLIVFGTYYSIGRRSRVLS